MAAAAVEPSIAAGRGGSRQVGFRPTTPIDEGVGRLATWYPEFHAQN